MSDAKLVNTRNLAPSALPSLLPVASKGISGTTGSEGPAGNQITESDERNPQDTGIIGGKSDPCRVAKGKETASHVMTGSYLALEAAEMAGTLAGAVIGGTTGLAVISIGMTALAASHIKEGIAEKSSEKILEGTGAGILAARTGFGALSLAGHGAEEGGRPRRC
ncbi:MAG: hypothetical protein HYU64_02965 [Armatimonadetes bacterium]|nr:hypothetical protein [Armatimonadota bacterium]